MKIDNKTILVTGGTGSFGNYIANRLLTLYKPKEVRIFSRDEKKQYDMRIHYSGHKELSFYLGDIRDKMRVREVMEGVDIVYQAAALKQVPACESAPLEAIKTNVLGVENVVSAALEAGVGVVVSISTDKAVKPVNVMGMTKALQERLVLSGNRHINNRGTKLCVVRYGNVLLSRGSVVPFFRRQLSRGENLTITDMAMTRFLLTLNDAIDLTMYATENCKGGETFVRKAPSCEISRIARILSEDAGIPFRYRVIGKFPGEKIHEILLTEEELQRTVDSGEYFVVKPTWDKVINTNIRAEYSSGDEVTTDDAFIRRLIADADSRVAQVNVEKGELSKI